MINLVSDFINNHNLNNSTIIVALSGGPDSIFLTEILYRLQSKFSLTIKAAYVNHGIRDILENRKDYTLIQEFCKVRSIILYKKEFKVGELTTKAAEKGISVEAVAREERYRFFNTLLKGEENKAYIALGHNRDDQLETQIMRFFQGASIDGLLGISTCNGRYIRPIRGIYKSDIIDFLKNEEISYNIDSTNNENIYLRNSIRNRLIPLIKDIFPGFDKGLLRLESELTAIKNILDETREEISWIKQKDSWSIPYKYFKGLNYYFKKQLIYSVFDESYSGDVKDFRLPERFLTPLKNDQYRDGSMILEGHGFVLKREGELLIWKDINIKERNIYIEVHNSKDLKEVLPIEDINFICPDFPFLVRSIQNRDKKILKSVKCEYQLMNLFIIEKSFNKIYAIINTNNSEIIYT